MKKTLLLALTTVFTGGLIAQESTPTNLTGGTNSTLSRDLNPSSINNTLLNEKAVACTDKVTYVDDNNSVTPATAFFQVGGVDGWDNTIQAFPDFTGQVTRIDIETQAFSGTASAYAAVHALDGAGEPTGAALSGGTITIGATLGNYGVDLTSPANVSNGFAIVVWPDGPTDSIKSFSNIDGDGGGTGYSFASYLGVLYNGILDFGGDFDILVRPTIQFDTRTNTLTSNPLSACAGEQVTFNYTPGASPTHYSHPVYNPAGVSVSMDFGDGSAQGNSMPANHTYSAGGTMNTSLTETYIGWSSNCDSDAAAHSIDINSSTSALFSWASTGLSVQFNAQSTDALSYSWVFGDGGTSGAPNPIHNYSADGSYTIELTVTGPCGSFFYSSNITIADGQNNDNVGIEEIEGQIQVGIFPNPSNGKFTLEVNSFSTEPMNIEILSAIGQVISSEEYSSFSELELPVNLSTFAAGTYFVHILQGNVNITRPIVIK